MRDDKEDGQKMRFKWVLSLFCLAILFSTSIAQINRVVVTLHTYNACEVSLPADICATVAKC